MYITGFFDIFVVLGILLAMLKYGAEINEYFDEFKGIFINYKNHLWEIKARMEQMKHKRYNQSKTLEVMRELILIYDLEPVYRDQFIDESIQYLEIAIQKLEHEHNKNPMKLMGLTPSPQLMNSIYMG